MWRKSSKVRVEAQDVSRGTLKPLWKNRSNALWGLQTLRNVFHVEQSSGLEVPRGAVVSGNRAKSCSTWNI